MHNCKPALTPIDAKGKLSADGEQVDDASSYRSLTRALQYLTVTRPDLAFAIEQACLHMHDPRVPHQALLKRILRYVRGTSDQGLHICGSQDISITAYSDANWAGCSDTRRSTSGFCVFLGNALVSWSSKQQSIEQSPTLQQNVYGFDSFLVNSSAWSPRPP